MNTRNKQARRKAQMLSVCKPSKGQIAWEKAQAKALAKRDREAQIYVSSYNGVPSVFVPFKHRDGVKSINRREAGRSYRSTFYAQVTYDNGQTN